MDRETLKPFRLQLELFIEESNTIEGERDFDADAQTDATEELILKERISSRDLEDYGKLFSEGCVLRRHALMDVRVGNHLPPPGGAQIVLMLKLLLEKMNHHSLSPRETYDMHHEFESLHPFLDANGRTGRAMYLRCELRNQRTRVLTLGFLHHWYYETLTHAR